MKKLITIIAVSAFTFIGTAVDSEARPYGGRGYERSSSHVYVSGYRHGRPIYTERYVAGYDCHGHPIYRYRTVSAPSRGYGGHRGHCDSGYNRGYSHRDYRSDRRHHGHYGNRRSSGTRVSFSFGR